MIPTPKLSKTRQVCLNLGNLLLSEMLFRAGSQIPIIFSNSEKAPEITIVKTGCDTKIHWNFLKFVSQTLKKLTF